VASLYKLPVVRTVELQAGLSGAGGGPDSHGPNNGSGVHRCGKSAQDYSNISQVREELNFG